MIQQCREKHSGFCMGWEKFYHYCFTHEVHVIIDQKPSEATMGKDEVTLPQCLQCIILHITPIQGMHTVEARLWAIYCILVIIPLPQRWGNMSPKPTCHHYQCNSGPSSASIHLIYMKQQPQMHTWKSSRHISYKVVQTKQMAGHKTYRNIGLSDMSWPWQMVWL